MDIGELLRSLTGGGGAAAAVAPDPVGTSPAPAGPAPAMGAPAPAAAPPAGAPASPPDLGTLYTKLLDQQRSDKYMDKGAALVAAGFAQPQNRAAILNSAGGGSGGGGDSASTALTTLLSLQKAQEAKAAQAAQLARLPAIAKQYGLPMDTVQFLYASGKLDETINDLAKPSTQTITRADGSIALIDSRKGGTVRELSPADPQKNFTGDMKEWEKIRADRVAAGKEPGTFEDWQATNAEKKGTKVAVTLGETLEKDAGKKRLDQLDEEGKAAGQSVSTIDRINEARTTLNKGVITGSAVAAPLSEALKVGAQVFGFSPEAASNTDTFKAQMKEIVLPRVKALGTGNSISNADRDFIEQAVGGSTNLTADSVREILRIMEKGERNSIAKYNGQVAEFGKIKGAEESSKFLRQYRSPKLMHVKPESVELLRNRVKAGDKTAITQFNDYFGAGAAESVLED